MSYRIRRKITSTTFRVQGQLCKVFLEPTHEYRPGFWHWNTGFAVGKSKRQINDWYWKRKNKRARSLKKQLVGTSGIKTIAAGFDKVLLLRWNLAPGDVLTLDCTSGEPEKQFRAWQRWHKHHQDWVIDYDQQTFHWYRPPYPDDEIYNFFAIKPKPPVDPRSNCLGDRYYECYRVQPKAHDTVESIVQRILLTSLDQQYV